MRRSPYQPAPEPLAGQDLYGGIAINGKFLRTNLLSSTWLVRIATEESLITEKISVHKLLRRKDYGFPPS